MVGQSIIGAPLFMMHVDLVWLTGVLQKRKWENCMTIDSRSWGFRRNAAASDFLTPDDIIATLVQTVRSASFSVQSVHFDSLG